MSTPTLQTSSLFDRLGGSAGIRAIVDQVVVLHMQNPVIASRFLPYQHSDTLETVKGHLRTMLEAASGGTAVYTGRSMPDTHRGMNVNATEYVAALDDILAALQACGVDEQSQKDVLAMLYGLKGEILHR